MVEEGREAEGLITVPCLGSLCDFHTSQFLFYVVLLRALICCSLSASIATQCDLQLYQKILSPKKDAGLSSFYLWKGITRFHTGIPRPLARARWGKACPCCSQCPQMGRCCTTSMPQWCSPEATPLQCAITCDTLAHW